MKKSEKLTKSFHANECTYQVLNTNFADDKTDKLTKSHNLNEPTNQTNTSREKNILSCANLKIVDKRKNLNSKKSFNASPKKYNLRPRKVSSHPTKEISQKCTKTQIKIVGNLKFCVLNTGGLRSKLKSEDFFETINEFDIICLLEIKRIKMILTVLKVILTILNYFQM